MAQPRNYLSLRRLDVSISIGKHFPLILFTNRIGASGGVAPHLWKSRSALSLSLCAVMHMTDDVESTTSLQGITALMA